MEQRKSLLGYLLIFAAGVFWGLGGYFVTQMSALGAPSLLTAFSGHFLALGPLLLLILFTRGLEGLKISKEGLLYSLLLGVLVKASLKLALDTATTTVGVAMATILLYLAPVYTAVMSVLFFKEKLHGHQYLALFLNLIGCALMVTGGNFSELTISGWGLTLGVLAGFLYALNTILGKVATSGDDPLTTTFYMLLFSALTMSLFARPWEQIALWTEGAFIFWALLNALATGLLANVFFLKGLSLGIDASKVTIIASVEVVVATLSGVLLLNEHVNFVGFIGILLTMVSIIGINLRPKATKRIKRDKKKRQPDRVSTVESR